ncbi:MAG: tRNA 2-thiouridine(34) synthase MnmA [Bacteroidia bacterium]|nr:tRNA 2-thiouridine(34) synthase MnmA [Bacteroidia bacterium]
MSKHGRVLVAMSGGIDSSVTAALLHEEGYEVIGMTMKTWDYASSGGSKKETGCCNLDSINDAREVAVRFGFPHYIIDIREEFGESVIENFVEEYLAGRTPNPCVMCNTHIKWEALLKRADKLGCQWIATGHYAQIRRENDRFIISRGVDTNKDQSYVLWGLQQNSLCRTIYPMGKYRKTEIREMARQMGFHSLANKPESYEICFIPDNDYRGFLKRRVPEIESKLSGGNFVLKDGTIVGKHQGYPFYTIGQRKGIIAMGEPYYVTNIIPETNTVVIGKEEELLSNQLTIRNVNYIKYETPPDELTVITKIRYKDAGERSVLYPTDKNRATIIFETPVKSITPGQSAVFYEGDDVVGGGWIERTPTNIR